MDPRRFDTLTRALTDGRTPRPSRRALFPLLGGLLSAGLGHPPQAAAKKKR